ncbi:hypothetical protein Tco_0711599 [Tanacetum coccineum]
MAYNNLGSDTEVTSCSKECVESYVELKKLYDEQREQLGDASIEIQAYTQALKKVEAQLVAHQKNQLWYEEKIRFMKIDLDDKTDVLTYHKKLLAEAVQNWLGYGNQIHEGVSSYEKEVLESVFDSRSSDVEDSPVHDRFANVEGMHAVPPPMTGELMPSRTVEIDDEYVIQPSKEQEKPTFVFVNTVKHVKTHRETVKEQNTYSPSPKADKRDWIGLMSKRLGLGYGFTKKAFNTARQNLSSQATTTSTTRKVNTARPIVNEIRPRNNFYKSHPPIRRPFHTTTTPKANFSIRKVNTAEVKVVSTVGGKRETAVKPLVQFFNCYHWNDQSIAALVQGRQVRGDTYGAELVSAARLINTARPKLCTAQLGWCCSKVFNNGLDAWIGSKMQFGLDLRFWNTASSQTVNDEKQIHATVDSKAVVVTEASLRSSLLLNDADAHTLKVFSNMSRKGVKFSGKVTPLFDSMLVPHQAPEGEGSDQPTEPQPTSSPTQPSTGDQPPVTDSSSSHDTTQDFRDSLEGTNRSERDQTRIKKLKKKSHPVISHHKAWLRSVSGLSMKRKLGKKESVSKQGRKNAKPEPTLDDSTFDDLDADQGIDYMDTEEPLNEGRLSKETEELNVTHDSEVLEKRGSNEEPVSAAGNTGVSIAVPKVSTATPMTPPTTTSVFKDEDIFLTDALVIMSDKTKLKGVAIKEVKESDRPERSILTLKALPSIDPKDKGKGVLKESPLKKVKRSDLDAAQIAKDAEVVRLVYEEELAELEKEKEERQRQEQASVDYIANLYDEVQAKMDASEELAARLQMEEREMYTVEERSRLLAEYFENRKKQLAAERSAAIRNKPPTRTQLRSLMMTYLKHTGRYKHAQLNKKTLEEIQALYIKEQERAADFVPIGSEKDERMIEKMNKKAAGVDEEEVLEEPDSTKVEVKQEGNTESTRKRPGRRLKMKATKKSKRQKTDSDLKEEEQLKAFLMIVPDEEGEIDYEVLDKRVFRADGSSRYIKTFTEMVSRFDRLDFIELHSLVMKRFETSTPEGIDLILWGSLRTMFEANAEDDLWKNQEEWILKSWNFYDNCGVHILVLEDGTEFYMLAERRYPLTKETLERMLALRLIAESESETGSHDGSKKDL